MALLFIDGFSNNDFVSRYDNGVATNNLSASTASPRVPGCYYASTVTSSSTQFKKSFTPSNQVFFGLGVKFSNSGAAPYFQLYGDSGATAHITVLRNTTSGRLEIRRGSTGGTLLATGNVVLNINIWHYVEITATISDTVGTAEVRVNGSTTPDASFTGDTKNAGTATTIDMVQFGSVTLSSILYADLYLLNDTGTTNNNFLGDVAVRSLSPNADGSFSQLTGSDGNQASNYQQVDELPFSSADYNGSANPGDRDTYNFTDLPAGVTTVYGVQVTTNMAKSDATLGQSRSVLRTGGTNFYGPTQALSTNYISYLDMYDTNPDTGVDWTVSDVNGIEGGMEVV